MCPSDFVTRGAVSRIAHDHALNEFGKRIRHLRKERGLTQNGLAEMAGVDRKTISRIENSHFSPTLSNVLAIADALEIEPRELL